MARSGSLMAMSTTDHPNGVEASEEPIEVAGGGLRIAEIAVAVLLGPPLLIVAVPALAFAAVVGAVASAVIFPAALVRRLRAGRVIAVASQRGRWGRRSSW